jgi:TonB family protein
MVSSSPEFQLGLLPERKLNWRAVTGSYVLLVLVVSFVVNMGLIWPQHLTLQRSYSVTELIPRPDLEPKPLPAKAPEINKKTLPPPPLVEAPKLTVPKEVHVPKPPEPQVEPPKVVAANFMPAVLKVTNAPHPVQVIHTGDFGSSATPTVNAPVEKVQTGGFGDPNGLTGQGKSNAKLVAASTGAFDLPQGAGTGNGSGGANGLKGTVASAGFGNGIAQTGATAGRKVVAQSSGFGTQEVAQNVKTVQVNNGPATNPVEITYKPSPTYTDDARQLQLQGEVLLEVVFGADGKLQVNRVVRGLGHGLDENAIAATNKIQFKPATRNGTAVDSTLVVHVVFQLAM